MAMGFGGMPGPKHDLIKSGGWAGRFRWVKGLVAALAVACLILGFAAGWLTSQWVLPDVSSKSLYDEELVISLFNRTSRAVVEVNVGEMRESSGSGFVVDDDGYIVTNNHVLGTSGDVKVRLFDGRILQASRMGTSPADDLALIRVDPSELVEITPLPLADSDLVKTGQMVLAIGSPFRNLNSMSVGVVSGVGRSRSSQLSRPIPDLIQTDAALNPGNSGGPLLNSAGEVIGISNAVRVVSSVQVGIGLAIPSNILNGILDDLKSPVEFKRPWLGIEARTIDREVAESIGVPVDKGVYIFWVCENSPAQEANLRGDSSRASTG